MKRIFATLLALTLALSLTACWSSFWGGLLSCISLYFFAPMLAQLALKFMSAEYFWLSLFGLTIIAGVSSKSMVKGLMSGALGLLLSTIGLAPILGTKRFMFGQSFLTEGINTTCALIGLFSMSQVFILMEAKIKERAKVTKFSDKIRLSPGGKETAGPHGHPQLAHRQHHRHPPRCRCLHRLLHGL